MRRRRIGLKLLVLAVAVVVAFGCFEVVLQVADPGNYAELEDRESFSAAILKRGEDGLLRLQPGVTSTYLGRPVQISQQGLRNRLVVTPKPAGVYRVLVVGDSVPFGWGVGEDDPFPRLVENELRQEVRSDGRSYEVINAGTPGWGLVEEFLWLRDHGMAFAPDMVLHCVINNDVEPHPKAPPLFLTPLLRNVRTLRMLERIAEKVAGDRGNEPGTGLTPELIAYALDEFQQLCTKHAVRYVVMDTVGLPELAIARLEKAGGIRLDFLLPESWIHAHQVTPSDFHPGAGGHAAIATRLLLALRPLLAP